ncbi:acyltransferase [Ferrimonas sp. YFM]|nr:acyltransferase [Ferrimonas sp. YFM]
MMAQLYHLYRIVVTGLSFTLFGVGGLVTGLLFFPLLAMLPGQPMVKERRAQRCVHLMFRGFVRFMELLWVTRVQVDKPERLAQAKGCIIIANHPCLLDVVVMISVVPHTNCIVKQSLLRNPFMRWVIKAAGYIANDDPESVVRDAKERLERGDNLIVFPEGTRTTPDNPVSMQRGAARLILRNRAPVLPVTIRCTPTTLTKGTPWYHVAPRRFIIDLRVGEQVIYAPDPELPESLQVRQLTRRLEAGYNMELHPNERIETGIETTDHRVLRT